MKKRILKLVLVAATLCLCIGAVIGIGATASDNSSSSKTPYILSKNVSYSSMLYCYYAVPKASVPADETPKLEVYNADGTSLRYTVSEYTEDNIFGAPCYIFCTRGVSAKDINAEVCVKPVSVNSAGDKTEGTPIKYGVLHYLYERLYNNGFVRKTESDGADYTRRTLYYSLMDYGAAAQELLYAEELKSGSVKSIYGDYNYYTVINSSKYAFCESGYSFDVAPASANLAVGQRVTGWTVYTYDLHGNLIDSATIDAYDTVTVDGIVCVKPNIELNSVVPIDGNTLTFDTKPTAGYSESISNSCGTITVIDGTDVGRANDNVLFVDKTDSGTETKKYILTTYSVISKNPDANVAVFSMDMMFGTLEESSSLEITFRNSANDSGSYRPVYILLTPSGAADGAAISYDDHTNGKRNYLGVELGIEVGEWFNFTVEYHEGDADSFYLNVYVNGELKYVSGAIYGTAFHSGTALYGAESIDRCGVYMGYSLKGEYYYDNVRFTQEVVEKAGDAHIENLPEGQTKYDRTVNVMVVSEKDAASAAAASTLTDAIRSNITPGVFCGSLSESRTNEIVLGYVPQRDISVKAYEELEKLTSNSMYTESRYVIYADGGKIAIAYDKNTQTGIQSITYAVEKLISDYISGNTTVTFSKGVIASGTIDLIEKQQILDDAMVATAWEAFKKQCNNDELYEAFVTYYALFKDEMITWMANLYDPGFGCFYSTTSGKQSADIFPNIEATKQILGYAYSSGMTKDIGSKNAFTPLMEYQIVYYVKSIQDPNGYFYLPQLSKSVIDNNVARLSRDLNWCVQLLNEYNAAPTYKAPIATNKSADGKTADEYWDELVAAGLVSESDRPVIWTKSTSTAYSTGSLSRSVAAAVSKVVAVSDVAVVSSSSRPDKYSTYEKFIAYLGTLNIDGNPYADGNELGESTTQIKQYSADLLKESGVYSNPDSPYNGMTMAEILIAFLNTKINDRGLFGTKYLTDNNPATVGNEFANTNGMMKIMAVYNGLGAAFPGDKAILATDSMLDAVLRTDQVSLNNICEIYNIWCALSRLKSNVKNCNKDTAVRDEVLAKMENLLATKGPEAVINAYNFQKTYQKPDGTFSHHVGGSSTSYPGPLPMGKGLDEGEIDAIGFGTVSTINMICDVFDLTPVPAYTEADWMHFLDVIDKLEPTGKTIGSMETYIDYESVPNPNIFSYAIESAPDSLNTVSRVDIAGKDGAQDNKALLIHNIETQKNVSVAYEISTFVNATVTTAETDMMFTANSAGSSGNVEFYLRNGDIKLHCAYLRVRSSGVTVQSNISGTEYQIASLNEWFTISIEATVSATDGAGNPTKMKFVVKVNGREIYTEEGMYNSASPVNACDVNKAVIICDRGSLCDAYIDNTYLSQK